MIQVKNVDYSYDGKNHVLKDFNLHIKKNEIVAIMGASGSGKSTLLDIMGAIKKPTKGTVTIQDRNLLDMKDEELEQFKLQSMGYVFQNYNLLPFLNVTDNIMLPTLILKKKEKKYNNRCKELLEILNIGKLSERNIEDLSGGERQRVAIARALIMSPNIVLADEPTGALDSRNTAIFMDYFIKISKRSNTTVVIVTHDERVSSYCDRTIVLE